MAALAPLGVLSRPGPDGGPSGLIPDASEALLRRLPAMPPGDYDVRDFVARCAPAVPILDGGALRNRSRPASEGDHAVLSGGLSISLLQLEADGFLTMTRPRAK